MAKLRNISTGVVISFDDALVDRFSKAEWESVGARSSGSTAAPAKRAATRRTAAKRTATKKAAAKKAAPVEATGSPAAPADEEA
jgi:topoisomerase IA-like protein